MTLQAMKRRATALLALAALLFVVSSALPDGTGVGFLRAASEAATVGGLADWFAVTALFRHPLGIPVPHTALVPRQKDQLALRLGEFVTDNFLTAEAVATQLSDNHVVRRAADALADPVLARRVGSELAQAARAALDTLEEGRLTAYVLELVRRDLDERSYAPVLGDLLARAIEGGVQRPLVEVGLQRVRLHLETHGEEVAPIVRRLLEVHWASILVDTGKLSRRLVAAATEILRDAEVDGEHPLRTGLDDVLSRFADDLRYSPRVSRDVDARLRALLDDPQVQALAARQVQDVRRSLRSALDDQGPLADRLGELVQSSAQRVAQDPELEARIEARLLAAVRYAVTQYGGTVVGLIQRTVASWDPRDASARIEASVGRDLQFIRINGTVVGALAGLGLHLVALLVG